MQLSRRDFLSLLAAGGIGSLISSDALLKTAGEAKNLYNVLFVSIDDLRPDLGCYGAAQVKSPNIDRLARQGLVFERAYCQQAVCNPSRASLLTGRRPDTTRVYDLKTHFRETLPNVQTLPEFFKNNGYQTECFGKIFHDTLEDDRSWSAPKFPSKNAGMEYVEMNAVEQLKRARGGNLRGVEIPTSTWKKKESWQSFDAPDNAVQDGQVTDRAVARLGELKNKQFFLAVGFQKPHLPFVAPRRFFDLYPLEEITPAKNPAPPQNVPEVALHSGVELRGYTDIPKTGLLSEVKQRELIRAYRAATSFTDYLFGRILDELERLDLTRKTIIILWGDHGFHLGEHSLWAKTSNFELDARAPFIISAPNQKHKGARTKAIVEFVDIYPTLCELCDLAAPAGLEGKSLKSLLDNPSHKFKDAAYTQFPRPNPADPKNQIMGRTVRTDRYRYTEWAADGQPPVGIELYDHQNDPDETNNIAGNPLNRKIVEQLRRKLNEKQ